MDAVYPAGASALARGRRARRRDRSHLRHRTMPVTFAEIKEVDEESCADEERSAAGASAERRRRPDVLDERLGRQFAEFRRRRARGAGEPLRELSPPAPAAPAAGPVARALSEPDALHRQPEARTAAAPCTTAPPPHT